MHMKWYVVFANSVSLNRRPDQEVSGKFVSGLERSHCVHN